jgi:hypothetical protein
LTRNGGKKVSPWRDLFDRSDYWTAVVEGRITDNDIVLAMSLDGCQLYRNKMSDTWIWIWIIMDLDPKERYKKKSILVGGIIPGPNKPKFIESFIYAGLKYLVLCQKYGLKIWNAKTQETFLCFLFLALIMADCRAMADFSGSVGHFGRFGCRFFCPMKGRLQGKHYYPACQLPSNYQAQGSLHPDVDIRQILNQFTSAASKAQYEANLLHVLHSRGPTDFKNRRRDTGIAVGIRLPRVWRINLHLIAVSPKTRSLS